MAFSCTLITPEQQVLSTSASHAVVPAHDGLVGILTGRAPILLQLGRGRLRIQTHEGEELRYDLSGGVAQMKDNALTILADEARQAQ
jgi:F-type H+-transporting ATPase subunit epsilon